MNALAEHRTTVVLCFAVAGAAIGGLLVGLWIGRLVDDGASRAQVESVEASLGADLDETQADLQGLRRTLLSQSGSYATCYLSPSGTPRRCRVVVRRAP